MKWLRRMLDKAAAWVSEVGLPASRSAEFERRAREWHYLEFPERQRLPDAVITTDYPLSAEQIEAMKATWERRFSGQLLVLDKGLHFEAVSGRVVTLSAGIDALWRDGP